MPIPPSELNSFASLVQVVRDLRGPNGCPWDKEQTFESLTRYAVEEAYEYCEAVTRDNPDEIKDELGDVLLQVVLNAQIATELGLFNIQDVIQTLNEKMVRRHPHVFSDVKVKDIAEVWKNWEEIKAIEKENKQTPTERFDIPESLSPLLRAEKIGKKVKKQNFDWENSEQVIKKIEEEIAELRMAIKNKNPENQQEELGDLLFSVAQLARHLKVCTEQSLREANLKFEKRFFAMLKLIEKSGHQPEKMTPESLENFWSLAKDQLASTKLD